MAAIRDLGAEGPTVDLLGAGHDRASRPAGALLRHRAWRQGQGDVMGPAAVLLVSGRRSWWNPC